MDPFADVTRQYEEFARDAREESPCLAAWAAGVLRDAHVRTWIETLPGIKKQPNLVFAAARLHGAPAPGPYRGFRRTVLERPDAVRATVMERSTQTNEVGRLATLVPVLSQLPQPLALIEAGASAGLNLYPDLWGYDWTPPGVQTGPPPRLSCRSIGQIDLPRVPVHVTWRAGVDLNPLDVTDPDHVRWLEMLIWPEQHERRARLHHAVALARRQPPLLVRGDLLDHLPELVERGATRGTVVVFHSAVAVYLDAPARTRLRRDMTRMVSEGRCHWVSNEPVGVFPDIEVPARAPSDFQLAVDGRVVAFTSGHGDALNWAERSSTGHRTR